MTFAAVLLVLRMPLDQRTGQYQLLEYRLRIGYWHHTYPLISG